MLSSAKRKVVFSALSKVFKVKPYNDKEFCKRSKGRGPKSFAWYVLLQLFLTRIGVMMMIPYDSNLLETVDLLYR